MNLSPKAIANSSVEVPEEFKPYEPKVKPTPATAHLSRKHRDYSKYGFENGKLVNRSKITLVTETV